jgi:Hint module
LFSAVKDYMIMGAECVYSRKAFKGAACFPGDATATLASGASVPMSDLATGDLVLVAPGTYSAVFMWTHRDASAAPANAYVQVSTAHHRITLTRGHHMPVSRGRGATRGPVPAGDVRRGDVVQTVSGPEAVVAVRRVAARGLYNPQTLHGEIVVGGVVASTYTTAVPPAAAHALLAPLRWAWAAAQLVARTAAADPAEL